MVLMALMVVGKDIVRFTFAHRIGKLYIIVCFSLGCVNRTFILVGVIVRVDFSYVPTIRPRWRAGYSATSKRVS